MKKRKIADTGFKNVGKGSLAKNCGFDSLLSIINKSLKIL